MGQKESAEVREGLPGLVPRLWRYVMALTCGHQADTENLTQTTVLRALERWCFTILGSVWKNELRARLVRRGESLIPIEDADLSVPDHGDVNVQARQVLSLMTQLPEAMRETLFFVYVEGCSYAEAAVMLDIPVGTVVSRLSNGRKRLNTAMMEKADP